MELLLSVISIVAYFFGYPTIAGIVGIIATILFVLLYSKQNKPYGVFVPWLIISILLNVLFVNYKPNFVLSIGIVSSISIWLTSVLVWLFSLVTNKQWGILYTLFYVQYPHKGVKYYEHSFDLH